MSDRERDRIAKALMNAYTVPSPWPVAPGQAPVMVVPPGERDAIERPAVSQGYDRNAIHGDDVMRQYFWPDKVEEDI
jgi:hypothetical protein